MPELNPVSLPPAYLCSEEGSFARNTLLVRLPRIARRMLEENRFPEYVSREVESLLDEMRDGRLVSIEDPGAPDAEDWDEWLIPWAGTRWEDLPFFVCETAFYRRLLSASGYFKPGSGGGVDPYARQKHMGLEENARQLMHLAEALCAWKSENAAEALKNALRMSLWGNRADLSLWPAGEERGPLHQPDQYLIVNHLDALVALLAEKSGGTIDLITDNAGFEAACDLALTDLFLDLGIARTVKLHLKAHPTFVSDAMANDIEAAIGFLLSLDSSATRAWGERLLHYLSSAKLILAPHGWWTSPRAGWEMPEDLRRQFSVSRLVISKGDANFRRLLGDLRWDNLANFADVVSYFPTRLAALRVNKSEIAVGLEKGKREWLEHAVPDWRTNGEWGTIVLK